jgi:hypothetical protein
MITRIVLLAALLTLGACASSPRYVAADGAADYGHYARKISENRYRVNYNGGRKADLQDTRDFALLRAAEITLSEGYEWFQVVDRETATTESREPRPGVGVGYERAYYTERSCGLLGCTQRTRPMTYTSWTVDSHRPDTRHSHSLEIVMGKGKMPEDGHYYDAGQVMKAIYENI